MKILTSSDLDLLYDLANSLNAGINNPDILEQFEEFIINKKINPSQIEMPFKFSMVSWFAINNLEVFKLLLKYSNEKEKNEEFYSIWHGIALSKNTKTINMYLKENDFTHINQIMNEKTPLGACSYEIYKSAKNKSFSINKIFTSNFKLLLKNGANINQFYKDTHLIINLLSPIKNDSERSIVLNKCLEYGFNPNLIFNKKNNNNFIMEILDKKNNEYPFLNNECFLTQILSLNINIDFDYKNKSQKTIIDYMKNIKDEKLYSLIEKEYLKSIKNTLQDNKKIIKRI